MAAPCRQSRPERDTSSSRSFKRIRTGASALAVAAAVGIAAIVATADHGWVKPALASGETRTISFYNVHNKESVTITYKKDGRYIPSAMKAINHFMRDWRRNEPTRMDPKLIDLIWELHQELGSREPVHLISGYRSPKTNAMLKKIGRNVATTSRHMHGQAADIYFPDVSVEKLRNSALVRQVGGVGYYPRSGKYGFVHVDTGRVRHWPRIPEQQLAAIFRNHKPSRARNDVQVAEAAPAKAATTVAAVAKVPTPRPKPVMMARAKIPVPGEPQLRTARQDADDATATATATATARTATPEPLTLASLSGGAVLATLTGRDLMASPELPVELQPLELKKLSTVAPTAFRWDGAPQHFEHTLPEERVGNSLTRDREPPRGPLAMASLGSLLSALRNAREETPRAFSEAELKMAERQRVNSAIKGNLLMSLHALASPNATTKTARIAVADGGQAAEQGEAAGQEPAAPIRAAALERPMDFAGNE